MQRSGAVKGLKNRKNDVVWLGDYEHIGNVWNSPSAGDAVFMTKSECEPRARVRARW